MIPLSSTDASMEEDLNLVLENTTSEDDGDVGIEDDGGKGETDDEPKEEENDRCSFTIFKTGIIGK